MSNIIIADTDELDDADLGINVDPKEYHKQKSLQMSLKSKLDMIKKDINKEADKYNKNLEEIAKRLNEENRERWSKDNKGDRWLHYSGTVNKEVLLESYKDGLACAYEGLGVTTDDDEDIRYELDYFKNSVYPKFKKLINGSSLKVYRGLDFHKLLYSDKDLLKDYFKYLKYNLMDRNSWTTSIEAARRYIDYSWCGIILQMDCTLEEVNLPLTAWLEGYWWRNENQEINLKKSFKVKDIKCVFVGDDLKKLGFNEKEFNKVAAMSNIVTADTDELDDADLGINVDQKEYHTQKAKQLTLVSKLKNALNSIKTALNTESKKYIKDLEKRSKELIKLNDDIYSIDEEGSEEYINYKLSKKKYIRNIQLYRAFYAGIFSRCGHKYDDKIDIMFDKVYNKIMPILSKNKIILYRGLCIPIDVYSNIGKELKYFKYNLMDRNSWTTDINQAKSYAISGDKFIYHEVLLSVLLKIEASVDDVNLPMTFFEQGKDYFLQTEEINLRKSFQIKNISIIEMNYINNEYFEGDVGDDEPKKKVQDDDDDEDEINSSALNKKSYLYNGEVITASSKDEAIQKIVASSYNTYLDFLKDYLKTLTPNVLDSLKNLYGKYNAIFSKDGKTVLFVPDYECLKDKLPKYINRGDGKKITLDAKNNHNGRFSPYYGVFELTWNPYYYKNDKVDTSDKEPYTNNMYFYLFGRKYVNGNEYDYTHWDVLSDGSRNQKELARDIARELRI